MVCWRALRCCVATPGTDQRVPDPAGSLVDAAALAAVGVERFAGGGPGVG